MIGGAGNDTYIVDNAGDVITENANEGTDTFTFNTYTIADNIENLSSRQRASTEQAVIRIILLLATAALMCWMADLAQTMKGGSGNDTILWTTPAMG